MLGNTLMRSPMQLVGFIFGVLGALWMLLLVGVGLFFVGTLDVDIARAAVTAAGAILTLGWVIGPVFAAGIDTTLDPAKLAPFPMTTRQMMIAITAGGLTGVPGIVTTLGALATFLVWARHPVAAIAAIVCVPLGVLICVVASRAVAALAGGLGSGRRTREIVGLVGFLALIFASPLLIGIMNGLRVATDQGVQLQTIVEALSWTPIGAAWAVPGDLATGAWLTGSLRLLIAAATLALLWLLWWRSLSASVVAPPSRSASRSRTGSLGWFGVMPSSPVGATWARSLTSWTRDMRYLRQLLILPLLPVLMLVYSGGDVTGPLFAISGLLVGFFAGVLAYSDVSYDGTAFATVLQTGIRGRDDRLGRMLGAGTVIVPLVVLVDVATLAIADRWDALPAVLGASLALVLVGLGVSAVSSALLVIPTPAPGDSPFKRVPGSSFVMFLAFLLCWVLVAVLSLPAVIPAAIAMITGPGLAGWLALAIGPVWGVLVFAIGVIVGGRRFDAGAPALLAQLRSFRGA
ncbi:ABC-2 type transport system permease protein [Microbacterium proteolyticum]|uniref:ABC-2 type transport system permease protein n=1 Tax=Microbacterium proteolyticum TaxID=1572644 RepID=A0A7W5CK93_9MICO|nr:ABC-2 type transport system permease protein [Microbacterium proteolyticum]